MEVAGQDVGIALARIEVDADREIAEIVQCAHFGAEARAETEHHPRAVERGAGGKRRRNSAKSSSAFSCSRGMILSSLEA